jgi:hypothetical protein
VHGRDRLFGGGNQIAVSAFLTFLFFLSLGNSVQVLFEIGQLTSLLHNFLFHKEWRLNQIIALVAQELDSVIDKGGIQQNSIAPQEISSMSSYLLTSFWVIPTDALQNLVVIEASSLVSDFNVGNLPPSSLYFVEVFVIVDGDRLVHKVTHLGHLDIDFFELFDLFVLHFFLLLLIVCLDLELLFALILLIRLFLQLNSSLIVIPLLLERVETVSNYEIVNNLLLFLHS